jgi:hypothetical protein
MCRCSTTLSFMLGIKEAEGVATGILGAVHGQVGILEQVRPCRPRRAALHGNAQRGGGGDVEPVAAEKALASSCCT